MKKKIYYIAPILLSLCALSIAMEKTDVPNPSESKEKAGTISVFEMIETGPPQLKLHALAMLTQGHGGPIEDKNLKTFEISAKDPNVPIRSVTAQIVGTHWIKEGVSENPDAVKLLMELSKDSSADVRFKAVYYGLANMKDKSDEVIQRLLEIAEESREGNLMNSIQSGLKGYQEKVREVLKKQLESENITSAISAFEIYEEFTGEKAPNETRFLKLPSSQPKLFIFSNLGDNAGTLKAELSDELKKAGLETPELYFSGSATQQVLMLKTRLTGDRIAVEKQFSGEGKYTYSQSIWLSPELEVQMDAMREK